MSISSHHIGSSPAVEPSATVNRTRLRAAVEAAQCAGQSICVVHIDLDRFHQINRRWGQQLGDQVLEVVGQTLSVALPAGSLLAPIDGDTFVAMVPALDRADGRAAAEAMVAAVRQPVVVGGVVLIVEASAGFAHHTPGAAPNDLLEQAFLACRRAKTTQRGSVVGYEASLSVDAVERLRTEDALRDAVARDELRLHVQPIVDLRDGQIVGVEALVRWQHPIDGLLAPAEFLPAAEAAGLTTAIGDWVLGEAIRLVGRWRVTRPGAPLRIWVNLAAQQLANGDHLFAQVRKAMRAGLIKASDIGFEVTESNLLVDLPNAVGTLSALRCLGMEIALDDFGTGYSSLTYLQQLPVTAVKIDRSFVAGIGGSLADEAIIEAVIDLAHALGLRVIAEGIEESAQAEALIRMGADEAQGFHFSYPQPAEQLQATLNRPWCGSPPAAATDRPVDRRADDLPGFGSARARLLLSALDTVHDSIVVTSAAPTSTGSPPIVYVNPAFEAETGFASADVVGRTIEVLLAEPRDADLVAWFHTVHAGGSAATREVASRRADGTTYLCEVTLSPILDERSIHTHWLHVRSDLSARRAEANDRARFQGLIEQSSSLVAIVESAGDGTGVEWVYANAALRTAIGVGPHDRLDIASAVMFGEAHDSVMDSVARSQLLLTGRWSGPMAYVNRVTGAVTEVITDINVVEDPLRPGVKVYASVSRDVTELNALERIERRRRELFGFAAELAQRALATGRDELFKDFDNVLAECGRLLRADFAYVDTIDVDEGLLRPLGSWRGDRTAKAAEPAPVDLAVLPTWIERLGQRGVLTGSRNGERAPWRDELTAVFGDKSFESNVYCGLNVGGVLVGAFGLARSRSDPAWSEDELATVQQIADTLANLLGRERADRARRASERHVNAMLSNVRDILVVIDREGMVRYANPQIEVSTGHKVADVVGRHFLHLVHPDDAAIAVERFEETINGALTLPVTELRLVLADGSVQWYDIDTSGVDDPVLGGYVISMRNISIQHAQADVVDRRLDLEQVVTTLSEWALNVEFEQIEAGLVDHLRNLGEALDTDTAGIWLIDGATIRCAAKWARGKSGAGTPPEFDAPLLAERTRAPDIELVVNDIELHHEQWAREWRSLPDHARSAMMEPLVSAGRSFGVVGVTMRDTPRTWPMEEIALVRRVADTIAALLARQAVETSLRASEARLAAMLDGSLDLVVVVDDCGDILYTNGAVRRSLGYAPEEMVGTNIAQIVHPDDLAMAITRMQMLTAGEVPDVTTLRVIARDSTTRWIEIMSGLMRNPIAGGEVLTCRDVTERHAAEIAAAARVSHLTYAFEVAQAALDLDPEEFLGTLSGVCQTISAMLGADFVYVDRIDEQQELLTNVAGWVSNGAVQELQPSETLPFSRLPLWIERLRCLDPIIMDNVDDATEPWAIGKREALGDEGGLLAIPMSAAGELFGVVGVSMVHGPRVWSDDEVAFLRIISETIAHVLERARVDDELRRSEARFRSLSETAADVVLLMDANGAVQYASPSSVGLLGYTPEEMLGRLIHKMVHPDDIEGLGHVRKARLQQGAPLTAECRIERADGTYVWVANSVSAVVDPESGMAVEYRASLRDLTERKRLQAALEEQALRDPLTGLGNRIMLQSRLRAAISPDPMSSSEVSVLLIDLDGFKSVNDRYGHAVGDDALRVIAARLEALIRDQDTLARTGGDEFVVICPATTAAHAVKVGERIIEAVRQPVSVNGAVVYLGASVGVAHHEGGPTDPGWLLIDADHAMYAAKREGRGRVHVCDGRTEEPVGA